MPFKESTITQLQYQLNSQLKVQHTTILKAPPSLVCMENRAIGGVS